MSNLQLISHPLCPYNQRLIITLLMKGWKRNQDFSVRYIDLSNIPDWFKAISPYGEMPVLKIEHSYILKPNPINELLNEFGAGNLHSVNLLEKARDRYWIEYSSNILNTLKEIFTAKEFLVFNKKVNILFQFFERIEAHLDRNSSYWRNQHHSLVDGAFLPVFTLMFHFDYFRTHHEWSKFPRTEYWAKKLISSNYFDESICPNFNLEFEHFFVFTESSFKEFIKK